MLLDMSHCKSMSIEQVYWTFRLSKPLKLIACPNGPNKCPLTSSRRQPTLPLHDNETLPIINKTKHPKKGGIQGTKWKNPCPRRQKNHLKGQTTRGTSSSFTCFVLVLRPSFIQTWNPNPKKEKDPQNNYNLLSFLLI